MQIAGVLSLFAALAATANAGIAPGTYTVTANLSGKEEKAVGRSFIEDKSLNPKQILYGDSSDINSTWLVESAGDGKYHLINGGWAVASDDKLLWAFSSGENAEQTWTISPDERTGGNAYIVTNKSGGWIVPANVDSTQVSVNYLVAGPSMPPYYPPTEVFYFTPTTVIGGNN